MKYCDKDETDRVLAIADMYMFSDEYADWSMDSLAAEADMSKNTLYKIVGNKEKLMQRVLLARIRKNQQIVLGKIEKEKENGKVISIIIKAIAELVAEIYRPLHAVVRNYPSLEDSMVRERKQITELIRQKVIQACEAGYLRKNLDMDTFFRVCQGVMIYFIKHERNPDFAENLRKALELVVNGIIEKDGVKDV